MKIATITDDGVTISQHFGRAPYYMVYTVKECLLFMVVMILKITNIE